MRSKNPSSVLYVPAAVGAVLIALSQCASFFSTENRSWIDPYDALFSGFNLGITLLLASAGFWGARCLLTARAHGRGAVVARFVQLVVPVSLVQLLVLATSAALGRWDSTDEQVGWTWQQAGHVVTFRANLFALGDPLAARPDLTVLAVLALLVQLVALLTLVVLLVPYRVLPGLLLTGGGVGFVLVSVLRYRAVDFQDWVVLSLDTGARSDAFLLGACALVLARRVRWPGTDLAGAAVLALVGVVLSSSFLDVDDQLGIQLPVAAVVACLVLMGGERPDESTDLVARVADGVREAGSAWLPLVAFSGVVGLTVGRHTQEMHWLFRVVVVLIVLALVCRLLSPVLGFLHRVLDPVRGREWFRGLIDAADGRMRS